MKLSREELVHLGKLAALPLSDAELVTFERDLGRIVSHVETVLAVDTSGVAPMHGVNEGRALRLREDVPREGLSHEDALRGAPEVALDGFAVPTFVES